LPNPWHYTNAIDFLDHWQALIAGVLGFAAAIIVVWITLRIDHLVGQSHQLFETSGRALSSMVMMSEKTVIMVGK
jgi:hypothetical protein